MHDTVPLPMGKLLPDLRGSYSYNHDYTPDWLRMECPNCQSDNVCCLDDKYNPELGGLGRWFCISCHDSWIYGYER